MIFDSLREFIDEVERLGECKVIEGADWDLEIGLITEWQASLPNPPLLLFDEIKGYQPGYRVVSNLFATPSRTALALGLSLETKRMDLVKAIRDKLKGLTMLPPVEIEAAPVKENIHLGDEVDLFEFPTPKWHNLDGGRYIGTGDGVIMKDPDEGWINLGTYRVQVQSKSTVTIMMEPGRDGVRILRKWWSKGLNCPVAIATGLTPVLWAACTFDAPSGISEYDYAGGFQDKPIEITKGITVDLLIPATAEIVLEGELIEGEIAEEGPFGEYSGYYAGGQRPQPVARINAVLHRNNPIIHGAPPLMIPSTWGLAHGERRAANAWNELDKNVPGIKGVWLQDYAAFGPIVVSIEQQYPGHAKQAAMAVLGVRPTSFLNPFVIVVDDDIDPSNLAEVCWAVVTRCDPAISMDIVRGIRALPTQSSLDPYKRNRGDFTTSAAIILACRPYEWMKDFPATIKRAPMELKKTEEKWSHLFE